LDSLTPIGFDAVQIGSLKEIGKKRDEFLLFLGAAATRCVLGLSRTVIKISVFWSLILIVSGRF